jgi:lipopolysaccharide export system protein LptC
LAAAVLLLLAGLSWWLAERTAPDQPGDTGPLGERSPDHFVRDLQVTTMTPAGEPARSLQAAEVRHYLDDESTELTAPHVTIHRDELPPWDVTAERGWVSRNGESVVLVGAVRAERAGTPAQPPVVLMTDELHYLPYEDYAETDARVSIDSLQDHVEAVGMRAWLRKPGRVELLSEVRGRYVPR